MVEKYFQFHSNLGTFRLFSLEHIVTICIILSLCTLLIGYHKYLEESKKRNIFRYLLAFLLLVTDASQHFWLIVEHAWSIKHDLPLQLSDLAVVLSIIMLFTKNRKLFQFMYFAGVGSSLQAILTPDLGRYSFPHFQYIEFFVSHGVTMLVCLFMVAAFKYIPAKHSLWVTVLIVDVYAVCVYFLNKILSSNYLYIMRKPKNASLLDYLGPWPWYLISMELVMVLSFYILYWVIPKKFKC